MRRHLLSVAALTGLALSALGADLPSANAAPDFAAPAIADNWSGLHVGGYGGGAFESDDVHQPLANGQYKQRPSGAAAGGLVGYDYQLRGFVVGVEGELGWKDDQASNNFTSASNGAAIVQQTSSDYIGRIRGSIGLPVDNALFFIAGGASFSDAKLTESGIGGVSGPYMITRDYAGWNIGAGAEFAFVPGWIVRVEYIYDNFGSQNYAFGSMPPVGAYSFSNRSARMDDNTIRVALIYKFGAPETVVAKY